MKHSEILKAGKARFTLVDGNKGRRWSFQVAKLKPHVMPGRYGGPYQTLPAAQYAVGVLTGPDNTRHYTYLGMLGTTAMPLRATAKSKFAPTSVEFRAAEWALLNLLCDQHDAITAKGFEVMWATTCARCGKVLTVPSSIDSRLGPECAKSC